jgi:hypothetical protein
MIKNIEDIIIKLFVRRIAGVKWRRIRAREPHNKTNLKFLC